ncbi:hypothetical protein [Teichococcus aestuarii]|uniref:hypothetical protein n=1 Tax=Teichococcus aestuarii TaxID=568898 RepID=UPI0036121913
MDTVADTPFIRLHPEDSVLIARRAAPEGTPVGPNVVTRARIPPGTRWRCARTPRARR